MTSQRSTHFITATIAQIHAVLTDTDALPNWNPALHAVEGHGTAITGRKYPVIARGGLRGHLSYNRVEATRVEMQLSVPGLQEDNYWSLTHNGAHTRVEHGFTHRGTLARLLGPAYRGVTELRLDRLESCLAITQR